jgi:hypothetical protein
MNFKPDNISAGKRGPMFFNFGRARMGHICPGFPRCCELMEARKMLEVDTGEFPIEASSHYS